MLLLPPSLPPAPPKLWDLLEPRPLRGRAGGWICRSPFVGVRTERAIPPGIEGGSILSPILDQSRIHGCGYGIKLKIPSSVDQQRSSSCSTRRRLLLKASVARGDRQVYRSVWSSRYTLNDGVAIKSSRGKNQRFRLIPQGSINTAPPPSTHACMHVLI